MTTTQFLSSKSTSDLVDMLKVCSPSDREVIAHIADTIERRHPELTAILNEWEMDFESTESQTDVIIRVLS